MRKRQWKKILSVVLALAMVFSMNTAVFADEVTDPVAVAEPAATEEPVAEAPAETEAPAAEAPAEETEEAVAEEPAASEAAAEETIEEPAAEAPAAAEVAEPEVAEEPAGDGFVSNFNFNEPVVGAKFTVSAIKAPGYEGFGSEAKLAISSEGIYGISVNGALDDDTWIVIDAKQPVEIKKVYVSADSAAEVAKIKGVFVSGNKIKLKDTKVYEDGPDAQLGGSAVAKVRNGQIRVTGGSPAEPSLVENWTTDLGDGNWVYNKKDAVTVKAVSADLATMSFNQPISTILLNDGSYIGLNEYKRGSEQSGGAQVYDFAKLKSEKPTFADAVATNLFGLNGDDWYTFDTAINAELGAAGSAPTADQAVSADGVALTVKTVKADVWAVVKTSNLTAGEDGVSIMRRITAGTLPAQNGYDKDVDDKIVLNNLDSLTSYTAVLGHREANKITAYGKVEFTTQDVPVSGDWVATNDWSAYVGSTAKTVSVNGDIVSINGLADHNKVVLVASDNAAKIAKVFVDANIAKVTLSANKAGVLVENASVVKDGVAVDKLVANKGDVIVDKDAKVIFATTDNEDLDAGDAVFLPDTLTLEKDFKVDYDKVTMALSGNAGVLVAAGGDSLETAVDFAKDTPVDVSAFVASENLIFNFNPAKDGYTFGVLAAVPEEATAVATATLGPVYNNEEFTIVNVADKNSKKTRYAYSAAEVEDPRTIEYKISVNDTGNYTVSTGLVAGETYHVYQKTTEANRFSKYEKAFDVTLGVHKVVNLTLAADKAYFKGDKFKNENVVVVDNASPEYLSANKAVKITKEDIDKITVIPIPAYSISAAVAGATAQSLATEQELTYGKTKYTILSNNATIETPIGGHDKWTVTLTDGSFNTLSADSVVTVDGSVKYYYGQTLADLANNAKTSGAKADDTVLGDKDELTVKVSKTVSDGKLGTELTDDQLQKLDKDTEIFAQFWLRNQISSNELYALKVQARPVMITAAQNFFSKMGDAKVSENKIDPAHIKAIDLFGTPYEKDATATDYIVPADTTADFTKVVTDNLKEAGKAQDYTLTVSAAAAKKGAVASGNIVISGANAEGFGYYVAPVYSVEFKGGFKSASFNNAKITPGVQNVDSAAVKDLKDIAANYKAKKVDDKVVFTADITLPTDVVLPGAASKFVGWKNNATNEIFDAGKQVKGVSANLIYSAVVKAAVPGFTSSQNSLQVEFDADVTYTGKKHVTDPGYQFGQRYGENGVENAITALMKAANAGTPDITLNIFVGDKTLLEGYDYKAVYKNNINAYDIEAHKNDANFSKKAPQVTITFKGGYAQYPSITKYFSIEQASLTATDGAAQGEPVTSVYVKEGAKLASVKTGLFNGYTGAPLVANKNGKKDVVIKINGSDPAGKFETGKEYKVTVEGKNNYKDTTDEVELTVVGRKDFKAVKAAANKAKDFVLDSYTNTDTYEAATEDERFVKTVIEQIGKNKTIKNAGVNVEEIITSGGADVIRTSAVKNMDYIVPGAKKINYAVDIPVTSGEGEAEKTTVYAVTGTIAYTVPKAKATEIEIKWADVPEGGVPYVATGATLGYETSYKGEAADLSRILTVTYSKNKNPGKDGVATVKPVKKAYIEGTFDKKTFAVGKAKLTEDNIALCYVVKADKKDNDAKTQKAIAKRGSVVIKDELGNVLKAGKDYDLKLGQINVTASGNDNIDLAVSGKGKYDGSFNLNPDVLDEAFLGNLTLKNKATGTNKNFSLKEMTDLEEGTVSTNDIAKNHSIDVFNGKNALASAGTDYDIVITTAGNGGFAFVTAVGIDGGKFGGSDVLAKKAIKVKVK